MTTIVTGVGPMPTRFHAAGSGVKDCTTCREDTRLSTRHRVFVDLTENELVDAIEPKRSYQILGPDRKIAAVAEARYCCMLAHRKLIIGTARVKENRRELTSLRIAPKATIGQIKCVMRLKPPRVQIANAATVVRVLPQTYTHRDSLPVEREYDRLKLSIAAGAR